MDEYVNMKNKEKSRAETIRKENEIIDIFEKASQLNERNMGYHSRAVWISMRKEDGIKRFKKAAGLGMFKKNGIRSLDEIAQILCKIKAASSLEEGRKVVPSIVRKSLVYDLGKWINIEEVINSRGEEAYRLTDNNRQGAWY